MDVMILRSAFSEIAEKNSFPLGTLIVVAIVVAIIALLLSIFKGRVNEFLRISDAELYVDKNAKPISTGATKSKTQTNKTEEVDPEKTVNMRTVDLPKKSTTRKDAK